MSDTEDAASDAGALVEPVSPAGGGGGGEKPKLSSYSADDIRAEITRRGMPLKENNSGTKDEAKTVEERRQGERKPVIIGKTEGVHASDGNKTETAFKVEWKDSTSKQGTWKDLAHLKKHIKNGSRTLYAKEHPEIVVEICEIAVTKGGLPYLARVMDSNTYEVLMKLTNPWKSREKAVLRLLNKIATEVDVQRAVKKAAQRS